VIAGVCGLLAFLIFNVAWIAGGQAQPSAYSVANDDISDLGAITAAGPGIHSPDTIGRTPLILAFAFCRGETEVPALP
jgi:hypothetical protein